MQLQGAKRSKVRRVPGTSRHEKLARVSKLSRGYELSIPLDNSTSKLLMRVSRTWRISKLEALRRALEVANPSPDLNPKLSSREAFHELQRRLNLTPATAIEWQNAVRDSRR